MSSKRGFISDFIENMKREISNSKELKVVLLSINH